MGVALNKSTLKSLFVLTVFLMSTMLPSISKAKSKEKAWITLAPMLTSRDITFADPSASTIKPNATATPTSKVEQTLQFPSTTEALIIIGVVVLIFGLVVNLAKKEKNLR